MGSNPYCWSIAIRARAGLRSRGIFTFCSFSSCGLTHVCVWWCQRSERNKHRPTGYGVLPCGFLGV